MVPLGLFGPPKPFRERTFQAPCARSEFLEVLQHAEDWEHDTPFDILDDTPSSVKPVAETIYLEERTSNGFIIAAGNRAKMLWKLQLSLQGDNPTHGTFSAVYYKDYQWQGNVLRMVDALGDAVSAVGGKRGRWPL